MLEFLGVYFKYTIFEDVKLL